ncbi:CBSDUFCH1 [Symbiodinium necroappetens]|uniref:CBSDUFCH1 protein n=1 Tax=Symbiodinium necroappetens TaxID=1628268 RepID=A0A812ZTL9_9DINO|nr:CBSDUFCH1 [Symbiodinium necroappetens]
MGQATCVTLHSELQKVSYEAACSSLEMLSPTTPWTACELREKLRGSSSASTASASFGVAAPPVLEKAVYTQRSSWQSRLHVLQAAPVVLVAWQWRRSRLARRANAVPSKGGTKPVVNWHRVRLLVLGASACFAIYRLAKWGSAQPLDTFTDRARAYHGVCGSLAADLAFSSVAFIAFAVCAGTETAITTLWPWKVREYAQREYEKAEQKVKESREGGGPEINAKAQLGKWTALREDIQRFMQTILIGATLAGVVSTAFITEICGQLFGPRGLGIATVSVTLVQLTLGEILPKSMAVSNPYNFAQATLPIFYRISTVVYPVSKVLNEAMSLLLAMCGVPVDTKKTPYVSEEELDLVFRSAMQSGIVDAEEGEMIRSVRNLDSKRIKEIMTPLVDMICIESEEPISKLHNVIKETQFSRIPVYEVRFDNIVGVVSMKTLLKNANCLQDFVSDNTKKVQEICDVPVFVPETMSLISALRLLKERTLAICVDEYGGTTGLITLEDVLEEIVGEIYDPDEEKDRVEKQQNSAKIQVLGPDHFSMSGLAEIGDVEEILGIKMPDGDYNSIGGFMCMTIDRIPVIGEVVMVETAAEMIRFEIASVDDRRVLSVEAFRSGKDGKSDEEAEDDAQETEKNQVIFVEVEDMEAESDGSSSAAPVVELLVEDRASKEAESEVVELELVEDMASKASPSEAPVEKGALKKVEHEAKMASRKVLKKQPDRDSRSQLTGSPKPSPATKTGTDRGKGLPDAKPSDEAEDSSSRSGGAGKPLTKLSGTETRGDGKAEDAEDAKAKPEPEAELPSEPPKQAGQGSKGGRPPSV